MANSVRVSFSSCFSAAHLPGFQIHGQICEPKHAGWAVRRRSGPCANSGDQDVERKRLRHVIVGAGGEAADDVFRSVARCQQQYRSSNFIGSNATGDLKAIHHRHHDIEHDGVVIFLAGFGQACGSVETHGHRVVFFLETAAHIVRQLSIVFHE